MATLPRPEGDDLYEHLSYENFGYDNRSRGGGYGGRLGQGELKRNVNNRYLGNENVRRRAYGVDSELLAELEQELGFNPLEILPDFDSRSQYLQDLDYYRNLSDKDLDVLAMASGMRYQFDASLGGAYVDPDDEGEDASMAAGALPSNKNFSVGGKNLPDDFNKEIPTATSMPMRPRTVAAVWDPMRQVLTLVFRDGTFYNYYDVSYNEWTTFKGLPSKWQYIRDVLNNKGRGPADVGSMPADAREFLYRAARTAQVRNSAATFKAQQKRPYYNYRKSAKGYNRWQQKKKGLIP